ncbi:MAG: hypothetical protein AABX90_02795, partial [Nanoarchaeota archaeon]
MKDDVEVKKSIMKKPKKDIEKRDFKKLKTDKQYLKKDLEKKKTDLVARDDFAFDVKKEQLKRDIKKAHLKKKPKTRKERFGKKTGLMKEIVIEEREKIPISLEEPIKPKFEGFLKKSTSKKEDKEFIEDLRKKASKGGIIKVEKKDKKDIARKLKLKEKPDTTKNQFLGYKDEKIKEDASKDKIIEEKHKRFHFPKLGKLAHKKDKAVAGLLVEDKAKNLTGGAKKDFDYPKLESNKTFFDLLVEDIDKSGSMNLSEISEKYNVNKKIAQEWGEILKEHGLVDFFIPTFGEPQLRRKGLVVKKGEKREKLPKKKINKKKLLIISGSALAVVIIGVVILVIQLGGLKEGDIVTVGQDEMGEGEPFIPEASVQTAFSGSGSYDCRDV